MYTFSAGAGASFPLSPRSGCGAAGRVANHSIRRGRRTSTVPRMLLPLINHRPKEQQELAWARIYSSPTSPTGVRGMSSSAAATARREDMAECPAVAERQHRRTGRHSSGANTPSRPNYVDTAVRDRFDTAESTDDAHYRRGQEVAGHAAFLSTLSGRPGGYKNSSQRDEKVDESVDDVDVALHEERVAARAQTSFGTPAEVDEQHATSAAFRSTSASSNSTTCTPASSSINAFEDDLQMNEQREEGEGARHLQESSHPTRTTAETSDADVLHRIQQVQQMAASGQITDLHDVVLTVHTFAKHHFPDHALFQKFSEEVLQRELWRCSWDQIMQIAWSYSTMREYDEKLFVRLAEVMLRKIDRSNATQLVRTVAAFTHLSFRDDRVLYVMGRRLRKILKEDETSTSTSTTTTVAGGNYLGAEDSGRPVASKDRESGAAMSREKPAAAKSSRASVACAGDEAAPAASNSHSYPPRFFEGPVASFGIFCQMMEIYARTSYYDPPALRRVFKYLYHERCRMYLESRANIARFAYYMHWIGVWHPKFVRYLKAQFLHSTAFDDESALVTVPAFSALSSEELEHTGGIALHRKRQENVKRKVARPGAESDEEQSSVTPADHGHDAADDSNARSLRIREDNLSGLILARATTLAFSMFAPASAAAHGRSCYGGDTDVRFLDRLLTLYETALHASEKSEEFTQHFANKRFCTALVACRFFEPTSLAQLRLESLRRLMPDYHYTDATAPAGVEDDAHKCSITVGAREILSTIPQADGNARSSILHEEVSAAIEKVSRKAKLAHQTKAADQTASATSFELFCGLYFVDTVLKCK